MIVPFSPELLKHIEQAGFKRDWDESLYIYEKKREPLRYLDQKHNHLSRNYG